VISGWNTSTGRTEIRPSPEREHGTKWRSDVKFKRLDGKSGTSLKATWSYRLPVYAFMVGFLIQMKGFTEDDALMCIEQIFQSNQSNKATKPNLASCKKDFLSRWGKVNLKKGVLVYLPAPRLPPLHPCLHPFESFRFILAFYSLLVYSLYVQLVNG
jgi:hypothetical protein